MKGIDYHEMIDKLISVTESRKLKWEGDAFNNDTYSARVGNCTVKMCGYYDGVVDDMVYTLELFNADALSFKVLRYTAAEDNTDYIDLVKLFEEIGDSYYRIRESEEDIMDSLNKLYYG